MDDNDVTNYGLTDFEIHRKIRKLLPESVRDENSTEQTDAVVLINNNPLYFSHETQCSICLGTLEKTWTIMACLHRFCFECIHRSLRMELGSNSSKECPLCRVKLASRRASRADTMFDSLIKTLKCGKNKIISPRTKQLQSVKKEKQTVIEPPKKFKIEDEKDNIDIAFYRKAHQDNIEKFKKQKSESNLRVSTNTSIVSFGLKPYLIIGSNAQSLSLFIKKPYLRAPCSCLIDDIKEFLHQKWAMQTKSLNLTDENDIKINVYIEFLNEFILLENYYTLEDVCINYWERTNELHLLYEVTKG